MHSILQFQSSYYYQSTQTAKIKHHKLGIYKQPTLSVLKPVKWKIKKPADSLCGEELICKQQLLKTVVSHGRKGKQSPLGLKIHSILDPMPKALIPFIRIISPSWYNHVLKAPPLI